MARIGVWLGDVVVPGVTVGTFDNEGNVVEVVRYRHFGTGKEVFAVMEHSTPTRTAIAGWYDNEREALKEAEGGLK